MMKCKHDDANEYKQYNNEKAPDIIKQPPVIDTDFIPNLMSENSADVSVIFSQVKSQKNSEETKRQNQ